MANDGKITKVFRCLYVLRHENQDSMLLFLVGRSLTIYDRFNCKQLTTTNRLLL